MTATTFSGGRPLRGTARVPGDKSISHRVLLLSGLAEGTSRLSGLSGGDDVVRTRAALTTLGIGFEDLPGGVVVVSGGRSRFSEPTFPIDIGNSGTGMRLLTGVLASMPFLTVVVGDASIHARPMDRIATPLREMGAKIDGREHGRLAPLIVRGGDLSGIDYAPPVASAQVKGAILFAGLDATGVTTVREAIPTRRHSEELFALFGADVTSGEDERGYFASVRRSELTASSVDVPGDPSQAAFIAVAAIIVPGSEVRIENVYVGEGRAGFVDVLVRMGASIELDYRDGSSADLICRSSSLHATEVAGPEVPGLIDEIPVLAVAAAFAEGTTVFRDAGELRVKESDRISTMTNGLAALGASVEELADGLSVKGQGGLSGASVSSHGDHRVAMSLAVAALVGTASVSVDGFEAVESSWPSFVDDLRALV